MKLLLDTHLLLWAAGEPDRLTAEAHSFLSDHFKSGQRLSLQNRPTGLAVQD
jgi:PIN domain nuclease of toxin-antitoxin system